MIQLNNKIQQQNLHIQNKLKEEQNLVSKYNNAISQINILKKQEEELNNQILQLKHDINDQKNENNEKVISFYENKIKTVENAVQDKIKTLNDKCDVIRGQLLEKIKQCENEKILLLNQITAHENKIIILENELNKSEEEIIKLQDALKSDTRKYEELKQQNEKLHLRFSNLRIDLNIEKINFDTSETNLKNEIKSRDEVIQQRINCEINCRKLEQELEKVQNDNHQLLKILENSMRRESHRFVFYYFFSFFFFCLSRFLPLVFFKSNPVFANIKNKKKDAGTAAQELKHLKQLSKYIEQNPLQTLYEKDYINDKYMIEYVKQYFKPILYEEFNLATRELELNPYECLRHVCSCLVAGISNNRYLNQRKFYFFEKTSLLFIK